MHPLFVTVCGSDVFETLWGVKYCTWFWCSWGSVVYNTVYLVLMFLRLCEVYFTVPGSDVLETEVYITVPGSDVLRLCDYCSWSWCFWGSVRCIITYLVLMFLRLCEVYNTVPGSDVLEALWDARVAVLDSVTFVTDDEIRTWFHQTHMHSYKNRHSSGIRTITKILCFFKLYNTYRG